ncbi:MAG TPA: hypothetical protein VFJ82_04500 [Longimicrobium sp.]|nr:hypothetical protein [Longimicrobium sp.]
MYGGIDYNPDPAVCTCGYELAVRKPLNGVAQAFTLSRAGAASYVRMGVPASAFAGVTATAPTGSLAVMVMRTK